MVPKPYQTPDICSAHFIPASSPACLEAKKAQTMWLPFRKRLPPPPLIPSRRPKALWRTQMLPHSFHRTTLPKRLGFTVSTAHWTHWRCPEEGTIRHELAVYLPFSIRKKQHGVILCLRRVIGCFLRRERDVTLRRLRKQQLHYKGRVIWLQTPLLHVSQRDSESNDGMTTALFSLLVQDDVKLNDLYLCS